MSAHFLWNWLSHHHFSLRFIFYWARIREQKRLGMHRLIPSTAQPRIKQANAAFYRTPPIESWPLETVNQSVSQNDCQVFEQLMASPHHCICTMHDVTRSTLVLTELNMDVSTLACARQFWSCWAIVKLFSAILVQCFTFLICCRIGGFVTLQQYVSWIKCDERSDTDALKILFPVCPFLSHMYKSRWQLIIFRVWYILFNGTAIKSGCFSQDYARICFLQLYLKSLYKANPQYSPLFVCSCLFPQIHGSFHGNCPTLEIVSV